MFQQHSKKWINDLIIITVTNVEKLLFNICILHLKQMKYHKCY